jgi:hypothetical protein
MKDESFGSSEELEKMPEYLSPFFTVITAASPYYMVSTSSKTSLMEFILNNWTARR